MAGGHKLRVRLRDFGGVNFLRSLSMMLAFLKEDRGAGFIFRYFKAVCVCHSLHH